MPVVKPAVLEMLARPEYAALRAAEVAGNAGCLVVADARLRAWARTAPPPRDGGGARDEEGGRERGASVAAAAGAPPEDVEADAEVASADEE